MQNDHTIQPGDTIAHCQVLRQIGTSGIGAVYLVRHELLGDLRAMKILPAKQDQQGAAIRIVKEARTARILEHPNLVKILDAGLDKEKKVYYILFEYVDGCTLADILTKTSQINEFHALIIAEAITSVLIAFSEQGFVHRNIKPENIILSRLGKVKLANLGRVKNPSFDSVFLSGESMAFISDYAAPEQISDFHSVDGRADIYSLGAVLFKMLIGTTDPTADPLNILNRVSKQSLSDPEKHWNISPSIARLLMRMMALHRSDRPADAKQLLKELQALKIIPPGTDREQSICEMISQAESGTYRLISLSSADIHTAQVSGLKPEVTRFWTILLCVLLLPLTWLAVKMFFPLIEDEDHESLTFRQPAVKLEKEASDRKPVVTEKAASGNQDKSGKEGKLPASGQPPARPGKNAVQPELTPEELYRRAENELQAGHYDQAVSLLVKASSGYPPAQMQLGIMYLNGRGLPHDRNQGIRLLTQAAQRGLSQAQYLLAMVYKTGADADPKQSLAWCRKAAASGHTAALKELALMLRDGFGCEKDSRSALFYLEQSARKGDPESMYLAGGMYLNGQGTVPNHDKALQYFRQAAAAGFSKADAKIHQLDLKKNQERFSRQEPPEKLFSLAENYLRNGRDAEALELLKMAAEKQYGPAELKLAMLHLNAEKIENPDSEYGLKLLLNAARQGIAEAQYQLSLVYSDGIVVKAAPEQAFSWCLRAADKSFPPALERLGDFYRRGIGCTRDPALARFYYEQGMQKGRIGSIFKLAQLLESGESGSRDQEKAVKYYRMAADAGHPEAKAALVRMLPDKPPKPTRKISQKPEPDPVPAASRDPDTGNAESMYLAAQKIYDSHTLDKVQARHAYSWCWRASAKGHVKARGLLGIMNLKGFGCPIDLKEAYRLLRDAAELGDAESLYQLGELYRLGIGLEQNTEKAESFYRQAAGKGHQKAKRKLVGPGPKQKSFSPEEFAYQLNLANRGNLEAQYQVGMAFLKGNGSRPDPKKAYFWIMKAALRKHVDAQCQVGILLQEGIGCTRSYQAAFSWFSKAAAQEHPEGMFRLGEMYLLGKGIDRPDHRRAATLFYRAALLGNEDAARSLDNLKRATLTNGR